MPPCLLGDFSVTKPGTIACCRARSSPSGWHEASALASSLIFLSLLVGMAGYHFLEDLPWIDAFLNAAMILGGMGPVATIQSFSGKLFAGMYALYSGLVVIVAAGVIFAPVIHRMMHTFHADPDQKS